MKDRIILLGSGGHARSVVDVIESMDAYDIYGFVDEAEKGSSVYRGYKMIGHDDNLQEIYDLGIRYAFVCVGYLGQGRVRDGLYRRLKQIGFELPVLIDPTAVLARDARVGEGTFIGKKVVINSKAAVGKMAIINTSAVVEHDCKIGDYCHISVNSTLCGEVHIEDRSFVGAGATVIQKIRVGKDCVIGAGSIVVHNLEDSISFRNRAIPVIVERVSR